MRQRSPYPPLRKTTERGRQKELDEAELCKGIASALTKGVYGRSDRETVDRRWQSELKEQSLEAAEGPRCWQGYHDKTDEVLLQTLSLNGAKQGSQWYPEKRRQFTSNENDI